jgi:ribosomal peptide maturation radical SAM protein 1
VRDVVLVSMPFGPLFWPSIGLSLLKAGLERQGVSTRVLYFTVPFADRIGPSYYSMLSNSKPSLSELTGEWIFSAALFGSDPGAEQRYVDEILDTKSGPSAVPRAGVLASGSRRSSRPVSARRVQRLRRARALAPAFVDRSVEAIVREQPSIVGFTSVFQQHTASLAAAERLKRLRPDTFIVFGGANCEGMMGAETIRQFPFVDAVVSGEADLLFPELVKRVLAGEPISDLPGVRTRETVRLQLAQTRFASAPVVPDLDQLPYPDYRDYFEQFDNSRTGRGWLPGLLFESSRGCWWGERMHCTFCGLNGQTMAYRSKSAGRALDELADLTSRHPGSHVQVVDNILDLKYFKEFLPALAKKRVRLGLFYETKSNLHRDQVKLLAAAGVTGIQPGIESFSDSVLKLMKKGVTGLHNIQVLKWCKQFGVMPLWNILWGFPGESPAEYQRLAALAPLLTHLPPPVGASRIRLDRFSPNFVDADRLGFSDVRPLASYRHIYALPDSAIANLAYYFDFAYQDGRDVDGYVQPFRRALQTWKRVAQESELLSVTAGAHLLLVDLRPVARSPLTVLDGLDRALYEACDKIQGVAELVAVARTFGEHATAEDITRRLATLVSAGLLVEDASRYLALSLPLGEYSPQPAAVKRLNRVLARSQFSFTRRGDLVLRQPAR